METEPLAQELSDQDRVLLAFGYLGPLAFVSLVASRREFVKWHAKQGLVLSAALVAIYLLLRPIHYFVEQHVPFFAELFWAASWMVGLGGLLIVAVCVIRGLEGERFKIPVLGDLADRL